MSGNVLEMCEDFWTRDFKNLTDDSAANIKGDTDFRVGKGGAWGKVQTNAELTGEKMYMSNLRITPQAFES